MIYSVVQPFVVAVSKLNSHFFFFNPGDDIDKILEENNLLAPVEDQPDEETASVD